jgi:hypothetical protein
MSKSIAFEARTLALAILEHALDDFSKDHR